MDGKISNPAQVAYIRHYTLTGAKEDGLRIVEIFNGRLRILLNESRALDIAQMFDGPTNLSFLSKNGLVSEDLPFEARFEGGMLYTCGLDSVGARNGFELHGTHHKQPARITAVEQSENEILVRAEIRDTGLFGKNLLTVRTVRTAIGSGSVEISDMIRNEAYTDTEYCLLYHVNLGHPMLDEGVDILSDTFSVEPRTPWAAEGIGTRTHFGACIPGMEERCYFLRHRTPKISVRNPKLRKQFSLTYSGDTLPCFVQWNSQASGDYALGLEPCTTFLDDKFSYDTLKAQSEIRHMLILSVEDL